MFVALFEVIVFEIPSNFAPIEEFVGSPQTDIATETLVPVFSQSHQKV